MTAAKAHEASFTAALVLSDQPGVKQIITASLDKSVAWWTIDESGLRGEKFNPAGGPIFSFVQDPAAANPLLLDQSVNRGVFCGNAAKSVVAWAPPKPQLDEKINLNGHTGWVRSVATFERWLFSCGCNHLKQWDASWPTPKEVASTSLFTGDILGVAAGGSKVFTCGADGSIRSWNISKTGALTDGAVREKAHDGRISAIVWHKNFVYSVGYDGNIKGWCADSLDLVLEVKAAHNKERIYCAVMGPDGTLYTGGEDKMVRRWSPAVLEPTGPPLEFHNAAIKALAAGDRECLVSGDANGDMAVWLIPPAGSPATSTASKAAALEACVGLTQPQADLAGSNC